MLRFDHHRLSPALAGLLLAVTLFSAGCAGEQAAPQQPPPSPSTPASTTAPTAATTPQLSKYTQTELAQKPCQALDERDLAALGVTGQGKEEGGKNGPACAWKIKHQTVSLQLNAPLSDAQTLTKNGRKSQVPVGTHNAVQSEFQHICFIVVGVDDTEHLILATAIPEPGAPQEGACPAGASIAAAALTHIE